MNSFNQTPFADYLTERDIELAEDILPMLKQGWQKAKQFGRKAAVDAALGSMAYSSFGAPFHGAPETPITAPEVPGESEPMEPKKDEEEHHEHELSEMLHFIGDELKKKAIGVATVIRNMGQSVIGGRKSVGSILASLWREIKRIAGVGVIGVMAMLPANAARQVALTARRMLDRWVMHPEEAVTVAFGEEEKEAPQKEKIVRPRPPGSDIVGRLPKQAFPGRRMVPSRPVRSQAAAAGRRFMDQY